MRHPLLLHVLCSIPISAEWLQIMISDHFESLQMLTTALLAFNWELNVYNQSQMWNLKAEVNAEIACFRHKPLLVDISTSQLHLLWKITHILYFTHNKESLSDPFMWLYIYVTKPQFIFICISQARLLSPECEHRLRPQNNT